MYRISGSGSLSLGRREATWWEVGLGGTPADEDMLAVVVSALQPSRVMIRKRKYAMYTAQTARVCSRIEFLGCVLSWCLKAAWMVKVWISSSLWRDQQQ